MFYRYIRIVRQLVHFISKMSSSTSSTSKQPEKRRRTDYNNDEGIHNFLKKVKKKIKYFN
jgi:hypothetical protein